ncbi:phosphodiesterase/alkaline phosphatase D-like protein [Saccharomonospora amisosensis]|uniref:Phosphodiesterase/alkaline phosphatase D-like protein n=1 Tax=Saccharomonospora amisosensis TaxID=1128677 RepID=A0A7X5ZS19_9PSEU|nr:hypothetical protein [Saccharomonospora amisosensis]NIJ13479.1 phosphodiesterase/alkaline phosphatase D-like protein [Saccharomonospora amisosensis]
MEVAVARLTTKITGLVVGAMAVSGLTAGVALADHAKVDGSITAAGETCSWTDGSISGNPPQTVTLDRTTVNPNVTCTGSVSVTLNNDPTISFDDTAGTATADLINVTVQMSGITCEYEAAGLQAQREGTTRTYTATGVTIDKSGGSFLCPSSTTADAEFVFH